MQQLTLFHSYHNTNYLEGKELEDKITSARSLQAKVLTIMRHENTAYIWEQWQSICEDRIGKPVNSCSLKRALSNLYNAPDTGIQKSHAGITKKSSEGASCHYYGTAEAIQAINNKYNRNL